MRSWKVGGLPAVVCIGLGTLVGVAGAVTFDPDATVRDRRVDLKWMPDADDPVFTGNLDLFPIGEELSVATGDVPYFGFTTDGANIWFWDSENRWFVRLALANSQWVPADTTGRLDESLEPLCFALHPQGVMLLAGLADGRIAAWTPGGESNEAVLYPGHTGAVHALVFFPLASPQVFPFVSVGEEGSWKSWTQPGSSDEQATPSGLPLVEVALQRSAGRLLVADAGGTVTLYSRTQPTSFATVSEHVGATVTSMAFSEDGTRFVTADASGRVRVWATATQSNLGGDQVETQDGLRVNYTARNSPHISYVTGHGRYGVLDGFTGKKYRVETQLASTSIRWSALHPAGGTIYFSDAAGKLERWNLGRCIPSDGKTCFGGYRLYRGLYPADEEAPAELELLRVYDFSDTTWGWAPRDTVRWFVDPDSIIAAGGDSSRAPTGPHNGIPQYYCLRKFYWQFLDGGLHYTLQNTAYDGFYRTAGETEPTALIPRPDAMTSPPLLGEIYIVPNPYVTDDEASHFGPLSPPMVRFFNLPSDATVRIYTSGGDHVLTLDHHENSQNSNGGSLPWNLKNQYGREVASGLYLYAVETPSGEVARGFFTVIR
jgi:WD40 repeat protein